MNKRYGVKTIDIKYGDAECKFYNIYRVDNSYSTLRDGLFHTHKHYECHFAGKGSFVMEAEKEKIPVPTGHLIIVPPETGHFTSLDGNARKFVVSFLLENVGSEKSGFYATFRRLLSDVALRPIKISEELMAWAAQMQKMEPPATIEEYGRSVATVAPGASLFFSEMNRAAKKEVLRTDIPSEEDLQGLLDLYVVDNSYGMEDIARILGYSPRHLARVIQSTYGMSLADCRSKQKCEEAKRLLRHTALTMGAIATEIGFKSPESMRETFKKHEGITPADYRKKYKKRPQA